MGKYGYYGRTLMRVLTTTLKPAQGEVVLNNMLYCQNNYRKIRSKIGYLPQEIDLYPNLSVQECLEYMGELLGVETKECRIRIEEYLERTSLTDHRRKKMRQLAVMKKGRILYAGDERKILEHLKYSAIFRRNSIPTGGCSSEL